IIGTPLAVVAHGLEEGSEAITGHTSNLDVGSRFLSMEATVAMAPVNVFRLATGGETNWVPDWASEPERVFGGDRNKHQSRTGSPTSTGGDAAKEKIEKMTPEELDKKADEILDKMRKAIGKDGTSSPAPEGKKMTQEELDKKADEILDKMRKRTSNPSFNNSATPDAKGGVERGGVTNPNVPVTPDLQPH
ncbi:MAG: hypothetical protein L6Q57_07125, partial [Alphaproteobacteria bacterium]|nr:hypothetical protein [Alphaproteobacteria bacterium]